MESVQTQDKVQTAITNDVDIKQKRIILQDSKDPKQYLITSTLIYISQFYPKTNNLLKKLVDSLLTVNLSEGVRILFQSSNKLSEDVLREIIYGPSTTFIPPSQTLHINRLDSSLLYTENTQTVSLKQVYVAHQQLNLETVIPKKRLNEILWYTRSKTLSNSSVVNNKNISKELRQKLELGGENWLDATPLAGLFIMLRDLWKYMLEKLREESKSQNFDQYIQKLLLLLGRYSFLHNKILTNPVKQLADDVFTYYQTYIKGLFSSSNQSNKVSVNDYVKVLIEYSYCLLFYYKYKKCEKLMSKCCELLELELEYTGKLGRRTKYQSFDCAQLILNLKKRNNVEVHEVELTQNDKLEQQEANQLIIPDAKLLVMEEISKASKQQQVKSEENIKLSSYDEDNILLEKPQLIEENSIQSSEAPFIVTQQKLLVALAMINYTYCTVPHDEMLFQYISSSISTVMDNVNILTFPLQFSSLMLRSFNEFSRVKYVERAIQQLETLKSQYELKQVKNTQFLFATPYLTRMQFVMKFANKYMDIQMVLTAVQLLKKAGMYEECVDGLIQRDYKEKALELVNQIIEKKGKTPRLLCMLGDIHHNDPKYYEEAWTMSDKKYGRAMRSLGWVYFNKDDFVHAAQCFSEAVKVNYYNPNTWFTLGCCYIRMEQFQKALRPFGESVRIDETQGEAWGNIASCYIQLKRMKQAYSTLEQAVKHSEGNWKIWSNLLSVSLSLKQFYKYFQCIERLVKLGHSEVLTKQTLAKLSQILKFKLYEALQNQVRKRIVYNFKRRIDKLFSYLSETIGQNPLIWEAKTIYLQVVLEYTTQLYKFYRKAHMQNTVDVNDIIDGYQSLAFTQQTTITENSFIKQLIIDSKQTQLNMTMKIGWDQSKIQCQKVYGVAKQYVEIYKKYNKNKEDSNEFNVFIKGLKDKMQKCLETKIDLNV